MVKMGEKMENLDSVSVNGPDRTFSRNTKILRYSFCDEKHDRAGGLTLHLTQNYLAMRLSLTFIFLKNFKIYITAEFLMRHGGNFSLLATRPSHPGERDEDTELFWNLF